MTVPLRYASLSGETMLVRASFLLVHPISRSICSFVWHDCTMEVTQRVEHQDRLARVLHTLRMRSTFYCHAELSEPWALEMPAIADSVSFHVVTAGTCWLRLPEADPIEMRAGDLALVPHGLGHELLSEADARRGPRVDQLPQEYVNPQGAVATWGGSQESSVFIV